MGKKTKKVRYPSSNYGIGCLLQDSLPSLKPLTFSTKTHPCQAHSIIFHPTPSHPTCVTPSSLRCVSSSLPNDVFQKPALLPQHPHPQDVIVDWLVEVEDFMDFWWLFFSFVASSGLGKSWGHLRKLHHFFVGKNMIF